MSSGGTGYHTDHLSPLMYNNLETKKIPCLVVAIPGLDQPLFRDVRAIAHA